MQITEKRNFMDIFYIVLAIHYTYRARGKYHVSRVSWLPFTLYIAEILYIWGKRLKRRSVDTHKAENGKWDRIPKSCLDHWIHP